jgi:hypothetical protein
MNQSLIENGRVSAMGDSDPKRAARIMQNNGSYKARVQKTAVFSPGFPYRFRPLN